MFFSALAKVRYFLTSNRQRPSEVGPSRDEVIHAYRLILGREPENEAAIDAHMQLGDISQLRRVFLESEEFRGKFQGMHADQAAHPGLSKNRPTLAFIHLQKTGGTSLREMLSAQFPPDRRCPILEDKLHELPLAQLAHYDFFAGHFDVSTIELIPRDTLHTLAMFREPRARLVSFYRFLKSHPMGDEFINDAWIPQAHALTPEEFFEHPGLRRMSATNNHYLLAFSCGFAWFEQNLHAVDSDVLAELVPEAERKIGALTALGISERFNDSVDLIYSTLKLGAPPTVSRVHVTDSFSLSDARWRRVEPVEMTARLSEAMHDLVQYDEILYRFALDEFDRRKAKLAVWSPDSGKALPAQK